MLDRQEHKLFPAALCYLNVTKARYQVATVYMQQHWRFGCCVVPFLQSYTAQCVAE